jgi:hypothetical protein
MFPMQGTQTVRLEEAILGTLSIINNYLRAWLADSGFFENEKDRLTCDALAPEVINLLKGKQKTD